MKAWSVVCALGALALSAVSAADCDLIKIFSIVKPLETNEDVKKCIAATGFELLPPPAAPTKEQTDKLCGDMNCQNVFKTLQGMDIPDCSISILGGVNMKKVINDAFGQCTASTASANKAATPAPSPAPSATPAPAPAPSSATPTVTPAPVSGATPAPAPTPAPTPAPAAGKPTVPAPAPTPAATSNKAKATGKTKRCDA